jgi:hypothetical protein
MANGHTRVKYVERTRRIRNPRAGPTAIQRGWQAGIRILKECIDNDTDRAEKEIVVRAAFLGDREEKHRMIDW